MTWRDLFGASMLAAAVLFAPLAWSGTPAHDFTLRDLSGQTVSLEDYRGQVVLVDFWATWCAPCKDAMPHWQRMYDDLRESGFVVLAVTTDDARTKPQVKPFIWRSGYDFPVLYDPDSSALVLYNPNKTLPFSVLIDRNYEIAAIHTGYNPGDEEHVRQQVQELLAAGVGQDAPAAVEPAAEDVLSLLVDRDGVLPGASQWIRRLNVRDSLVDRLHNGGQPNQNAELFPTVELTRGRPLRRLVEQHRVNLDQHNYSIELGDLLPQLFRDIGGLRRVRGNRRVCRYRCVRRHHRVRGNGRAGRLGRPSAARKGCQ